MTVYFHTDTEFNLDTIRIMGVSAKLGENPIGYFGTGLKYAIAILLRTGHTVVLRTDGKEYNFTYRNKDIRGKIFPQVYMNDEPLSFTTDLGKNWEVWQAYRELHSNTLDEGGRISQSNEDVNTTFIITGKEIEKAYADRCSIFLSSEPVWANPNVEIHTGSNLYIYYRGVRCSNLQQPSLFTYNILAETTLSEDRVFKDTFDMTYCLSLNLPRCENSLINKQVVKSTDSFEFTLTFNYCSNPSENFLESAEKVKSNAVINYSILVLLEKHRGKDKTFPTTPYVELSTEKQRTLAAAISLCNNCLGTELILAEIGVCKTLGNNILGLYHEDKDQIYIADELLERGLDLTVAVLYEEHCHQSYDFLDESRAFQSHLLHKLVYHAIKEKN